MENTSSAEQQTTEVETVEGLWYLLIIHFQQKASFCNSHQGLVTVSGCAVQGAPVWSVSDAAHPQVLQSLVAPATLNRSAAAVAPAQHL